MLAALVIALAAPPATPLRSVTDTYHGIAVRDDYRWLEDWKQSEVHEWSEAQNAHARAWLDDLPEVDTIRQRVKAIFEAPTVRWRDLKVAAGLTFAMKWQPPKQQPVLVVMASPDRPETARALVDPSVLDGEGTTAIDWYVPSPDGKQVAVSLSKGGSESGDLHFFDVATGRPSGEPLIKGVNGGTAGGHAAWLADGSGIFYTRYPRSGERPEADLAFFEQLYFHRIGTPIEHDRYELGKDLPRIAEIMLDMDHASGRMLATVQNGDGGEFELHLREKNGAWTRLAEFRDATVQATFGPAGEGQRIYMLSRAGAPKGRVLSVRADAPTEEAKVVVAEGGDSIVESFWDGAWTIRATRDRLYVVYQLGGPSEIRAFDLDGRPTEPAPTVLPISAVGGLVPEASASILFDNVSYLEPAAWYRFDPKTGRTSKTGLFTSSPVDLSDAEVVREFASSWRGGKEITKVPVNIIRLKGAELDGAAPCLATGYGGYAVNIAPEYRAINRILLDRGFCVAEANLRGGGEFGEAWHRAGNLTKKQNVFDDFAGVLEHLVTRGYTKPDRLAAIGGSNGGLLMGAMLTQHPDLLRVVVSRVGIYDMLRVELSPNGAFNVPEYGTVSNVDHFRAMYRYSPYHNVKDQTAYPPTLLMTGQNDPRVDPMHSRKMAARLQAAALSKKVPILLRTSANTGHGGQTSLADRVEEQVDIYAFIFNELGLTKPRP